MPSVLFVDDEVHSRHHYVRALEYSGCQVKVCNQVDEAYSIVQEQSFDLIILDIMMPPGQRYGINGSWTDTGVRFFRDLATLAIVIPIIIFTNVSLADVRDQIPTRPGLEIHAKTDLSPTQLASLIERLCRKP